MKRTQVLGGGARQLVMASAIAAALDTDTAEEVTLTVSEPGVLDLDTLCIFAGATAVELYASQDFSLYTRIDSIKINNSLQLLRGRNIASAAGTAGAPGIVRVVDVDQASWEAIAFRTEAHHFSGDDIPVRHSVNGAPTVSM